MDIPAAALPLDGVRVVELCNVAATFISPLRLDGRTSPVRAGRPALDGHRTGILAELGATNQEVLHD